MSVARSNSGAMCEKPANGEWAGVKLPAGLTPERAAAAAQLIYDYETVDFRPIPLSRFNEEVLTRSELVVKLFSILCAQSR